MIRLSLLTLMLSTVIACDQGESDGVDDKSGDTGTRRPYFSKMMAMTATYTASLSTTAPQNSTLPRR